MSLRPTEGAAADCYYYRGKPVFLQRDPSLVGVDLAVGAAPLSPQGLRTPDGNVAITSVVVEMPRPGRYVCRIESAAGAAAAPLAPQSAVRSLTLDSRIQRTYPVFRNPKNGLLVFVFDEIIVRVRPGIGPDDLLRFGSRWGIEIAERNTEEPDIFLLRIGSQAASALDTANEYSQSGLCLWAEPNFGGEMKKSAVWMPNDPHFYKQWHLNNTGQTGGTPGADVSAPRAWAITSGSAQVVIALLDDGCDLNHEDLKANILTNPGESGGGRENNHIDDDHNGYVDDVHGWDFFDNDNTTSHNIMTGTLEGHGTATAGIAAAVGNNRIGVSGIAPRCKILECKIFKGNDYAGNYQVAKALFYAAQFADAISNSWGGGTSSSAIDSAIQYAVEKGRRGRGCPVFFASGNESATEVSYPATNVWSIAVGATDANDRRFYYSNYGPHLTVVTPSGNFTTDRTGDGVGYDSGSPDTTGNYTGIFGGTSSACPLAAGTAALLISLDPTLTALQIRTLLQRTADKVSQAAANYNSYGFSSEYGYGRINAFAALDRVKQGAALIDDSFEPNNTQATARLVDKGFYSGLAALDDDWFATDVSPYQDIVLQTYFIHPFGDLQLELYNPSGVLVASSTGTTDTEQIELNAGAIGGRWRFRVFGKNGAKNYYLMSVNKRPPDDRFEQNDTLATAATIAPGDYYDLRGYDPDYYRVHVRSGEKIMALIRFVHDLGDLDLYLLDTSGTVLSASATVKDVEGVWQRNTGPDTDYILFVDNYAGAENAYQMHVEIGPGADDSFEPNNTQTAASLVLPGVYRHLQPYNDDWYKVAVGPRQILETEIQFFNAVGDIDMDILDAAGQVVDRSEGSADIERVIFVNTGNTSTFAYPHVYPFGTDYPDYEMTVSLRPLAEDVFQKNDDLNHTATIAPGATYNDLVALRNDFFGVPVAADKTLAVIVADEESLPRLGLNIYTPAAAPLASSTTGEPTVVVARQVPASGTYRLGVTLPTAGAVNLYGLTTFVYDSATPATDEDSFEPNNSRRYATAVAQGAYPNLYCANDDYFKIALDQGDTLYVGIAFDGARSDLDLVLYDPWGQLMALSANGTRVNTELCVIHKAPAAGPYYIRVYPVFGSSWYDLLIGRKVNWTKGLTGVRHWKDY